MQLYGLRAFYLDAEGQVEDRATTQDSAITQMSLTGGSIDRDTVCALWMDIVAECNPVRGVISGLQWGPIFIHVWYQAMKQDKLVRGRFEG
jgi:hypothetical protein